MLSLFLYRYIFAVTCHRRRFGRKCVFHHLAFGRFSFSCVDLYVGRTNCISQRTHRHTQSGGKNKNDEENCEIGKWQRGTVTVETKSANQRSRVPSPAERNKFHVLFSWPTHSTAHTITPYVSRSFSLCVLWWQCGLYNVAVVIVLLVSSSGSRVSLPQSLALLLLLFYVIWLFLASVFFLCRFHYFSNFIRPFSRAHAAYPLRVSL